MSTGEQAQAGAPAAAEAEAQAISLDDIIKATKQTERSRTEDLMRTLTEEALKGTVTYDKNITAG